ncbi:hypothetical protein [Pseudomonas sp. St316]|nr:hypothetical protein [Pseudomonas sp. St316]
MTTAALAYHDWSEYNASNPVKLDGALKDVRCRPSPTSGAARA